MMSSQPLDFVGFIQEQQYTSSEKLRGYYFIMLWKHSSCLAWLDFVRNVIVQSSALHIDKKMQRQTQVHTISFLLSCLKVFEKSLKVYNNCLLEWDCLCWCGFAIKTTLFEIYMLELVYIWTQCVAVAVLFTSGHKKDTDSVWLTCIFAWFPHALCCCLLKLRTPPQRRRPAERQQHTWAMSLETETSASTSACCLWVWFSDILRLIHCIRFVALL